MSYTLYGIPNCDSVKKAKSWLAQNDINFDFYNYKTENVRAETIKNWLEQAPLSKVLNRASTTFRKLSDADKAGATDANHAIKLMQENPSMIKRPILEKDGKLLSVGFKPDQFAAIFSV